VGVKDGDLGEKRTGNIVEGSLLFGKKGTPHRAREGRSGKKRKNVPPVWEGGVSVGDAGSVEKKRTRM